ncbi:hypothetical protein BJX76DRAFT_260248 [Aspergillus varians]
MLGRSSLLSFFQSLETSIFDSSPLISLLGLLSGLLFHSCLFVFPWEIFQTSTRACDPNPNRIRRAVCQCRLAVFYSLARNEDE